ncbi:hypothetical protein E5358_12890 [Palleniella muris]|uniref:Uncharacterized protein n=1 Tax=Palleniella muris TaxID=3038145 RepID=A0AC61QMG4_9BACT|nr:HAD hydrolase-like protein [Palleniella muris]TGX80427.1 hypothetical protein E5358_12890 [Palleniella muris]
MKTIIFDFDGTLADTRRSIVETVFLTLSHFNLPQPSAERIQSVIGLPLRDTFTCAAGLSDEETITKCIEFYRSNYDMVCLKSVTLFPNVTDTLKAFY